MPRRSEPSATTHSMSPTVDKIAGFELIKRARALVAGVNASVSEATQRQYSTAFARMENQSTTPEKLANTSRSFYYYRAAWINHFSIAISSILNSADKEQKAGNKTGWQEEIKKLTPLITELERYRPDPEKENLAKGLVGQWSVEAERRKSAGKKIQSHSKKSRLRGLPQNWRELMFNGLGKTSKYRDVVGVLSATGARPAEFETGIAVTLEGEDSLRFRITGAKTSGGKYGQAERAFTVKADRPELEHLLFSVQTSSGTLLVKSKAGALSDRIRQLSAKVFPLLRSDVSAYVFRHQTSADLKASGLSDVDVSAALGHSVDDTKGSYGAAQSARAPGGVSAVTATRPVRQKTREKVLQLQRGIKRSYGR
jgi:integrase